MCLPQAFSVRQGFTCHDILLYIYIYTYKDVAINVKPHINDAVYCIIIDIRQVLNIVVTS